MDSLQNRRKSVMADQHMTILSGNVIVIRKRYCTVAVLLVCLTWIYLQAAARMETGVNIRAHFPPAPAKVAQTKANLKYRTHLASGMNDIRHSKQLSSTETSVTNINENKSDRDKLEKVPEKSEIKDRGHSRQTSSTDKHISNNDKDSDRNKEENSRQKDEIKVHSRRKIVVILAYMRTGSTLTGSVYQSYPDTFYVYEPFRVLTHAFKEPNRQEHVELKYMNGKERIYSASERRKAIIDEINGWLDCKLDSITPLSLKGALGRYFTMHNDMFHNCSKEYISDSCLKKAIRSCHNTPLLALKVIRFRVQEFAKLLPYYPNMKIIHLVRDPRGIFNSRLNSGAVTTDNYKATVRGHCSNVEEDLKSSKQTLQKYSDKLKILHYEDLAERPLETARALIEFVGLEFVKSVKNRIVGQTHAAQDNSAFATRRKNSTETASRWRFDIDPEIARYIYKTCKTSNTFLGYLPLESVETLRNTMIPSRKIKLQ